MSIAIKRNFTIPSTSAIGATELYLSSSVASTTIGTGALTVAGGAGVSGVISLGGALKLFNGSFYTGFDSAATANTTYIWPATSPATGTSVLSSDAAGNLSWILMSASGSGFTLNGLTATTQYFSTSISGNGFTIGSIGSTHTFYIGLAGNASTGLISGTAQTIFGLKYFASGIAITSGTASTNTTTGDLVVTGGIGIGGSLWTSSTNYSSISGVGISNGVVTGTLSGTASSAQVLNTTTDNSSTLYILGSRSNGGFAGTSIYVNTSISALGNTITATTFSGTATSATNSANTNVTLDTTSTIYLTGSRSNSSTGSTPTYVLSGVSALGNTITATTFTGALSGTASSSALVNTDATTGTRYLLGTALNIASGSTQVSVGSGITIGNNLLTSGGIAVTNSTASSSTTTGALIITGGVGIGGSLWTSTTNFSSISGVGHSNSVITSGVWSGTAISAVNGGTGIASYTTGDILYASSSTTLARITAGTAGSVLTSAGAGSTPYWAVATAGAATGLTLNGLTASTQFFATSISGSGFTIGSTGSTHTYYIALAGNASTGLISGAAQTIFGLKTFASGVAITSGTASTNTTTGALSVAGGVGITGQLSVNTVALGTTAVSITPSMIFTGTAGTVITMSVLSDTTLAWEGSSGQLFSIDNNLSSGEIFSVSDISGLPIISASAGQSIYLNEFGGFTQVGNGLASTNTTSGALRVIGGVGITGSLYLGSPLLIPSGGTGLTTYTTGDILYASSSTTLARITAGTAGSVLTSAGTGATPYWAAATGVTSINGLTSSTQTFATSISGSGFTIGSSTSTHTFYIGLAGNASTGLISATSQSIYGAKTFINDLATSSSTASTSTSSGALTIMGGVGIGGSLWTSTTNFSSISGVGHSNSTITSGVWSGTAISAVNGGTGFVSYTTGDILHASSSTTLGKIAAGTAGSILTSAGTGATPYWAAATGSTLAIAGTNNGDIQYKSASALGASSALNFDASTSTFKLTGFPIEAVSSSSANVKLLGGSVSWNGSINGTMLAVNTANSYVGDLFNAQIGGTSRFKVSYTGAVSIGNSYTLPITDGTANQVLQTNGSGTISWADSVISSAQYNIGYYASAGAALTGSSTFTNNTSTGVVSIGHSTSSTGFSTGALVVTGGVGIGATVNIGADLGISGLTTLTYTSEKLNTKTSATGTVTHDLSTGSVFYHSSISNNFTANITNVPTTNDRAIGVTLVLAQGVTPYMSTALQIDGSAQTIKWVNNSTPTGTASKVDIVGFSLIRTGSAWTVLGQYSTYG